MPGREDRRRAIAVAAGCLLAVVSASALLGSAMAAKGDLLLRSKTGTVKGNASSFSPAIGGPDGDPVAFVTDADNLFGGDSNGTTDVVLQSAMTGGTGPLSRADGPAGALGNGFSIGAAAADEAPVVAYESTSTNLDGGDGDSISDIYVRNWVTDDTELISVNTGGGVKGNATSIQPSISDDGRYVAFRSAASNLHPDDLDGFEDIYVRDRTLDTTTLVSRIAGDTGLKLDSVSTEPSISGDGQEVAFTSYATNLPGDGDSNRDIYVSDAAADTTEIVSQSTLGAKGNDESTDPVITPNGRYVAFESNASNLHPDDVDVADDVFVRDRTASTTAVASRADGLSGATAGAAARAPSISDDGRYVSFWSLANNLSPDDQDGVGDIFHRDMTGVTTLVSRASGTSGEPANADTALDTSISDDGRYVAFASDVATNLDPADSDITSDIYSRDVLGVVSAPVQAKKVNVEPVAGAVTVKRPGRSKFIPLREADSIPVGSQVDTRKGVVRLTSAKPTGTASSAGASTQSALFKYGIFQVTQGARAGAFTQLKIINAGGCGAGSAGAASGGGPIAHKAGKGSKLWGKGSGKFRVGGKRGSGAARGTTWQVTNLCNGKTEIRSIHGRVTARDFVRKRTVILRTGQRYVAPGKPRGQRRRRR